LLFLGVIDEVMSIFEAEEAATAAALSSTQRLKRRQFYANRDREAAHFRLWHDYFDDNYVYPVILLPDVSYADDSFSKHYAEP
jgi:hypothetical protein